VEKCGFPLKTVNNDYIRRNFDLEHMLLGFLCREKHPYQISGQKVEKCGFPLKAVKNDHIKGISTIYEGILMLNICHYVS